MVGPFRLTKALLGALAASAREGRGAVVLNVSSDAAVNAYPRWGAYGTSKAALRHLSAVWNAELEETGVRFLSLDPGDMDTPMLLNRAFLGGRPRGRSVASSPTRRAVFSTHAGGPYGVPRCTQRREASTSPDVR